MKRAVLHPLLFAVYPVVSLLATNIQQVAIQDTIRPALVSLGLILLLWGLWSLVLRDWERGGLMASLAFGLVFAYGHVYGLMPDAGFAQQSLVPVSWLAFGLGGWWIISRLRNAEVLSRYLNWLAALALLMPAYSIAAYQFRSKPTPTENGSGVAEIEGIREIEIPDTAPKGDERLPDVYYIVLDGYGRADALAELYEFDNNELVSALEARGFYVAEDSYANYNQTFLSIPTALNMAYISELVDIEGGAPFDYETHVRLIHENRVFEIFREMGYKVVGFSTGLRLTSVREADYFLASKGASDSPEYTGIHLLTYDLAVNSFEALLLETTAFRPIFGELLQRVEESPDYQQHRDRILFVFSNLDKFAAQDGRYFVFAHIIAPHPPFVFMEDGEPRVNALPYSVADASHFVGRRGTRAEYIEGYRAQIQYVNKLLIEAVDRLLSASEIPPVIVIQGDHGPGAYFSWNSLERTDLKERMAIFNAYYLPKGAEQCLYPEITTVNTFRVVLRCAFDFEIELREDRVLFSKWIAAYDFVDVTDRLFR